MNTDITREIINDLLPAYLAGEASPGTRALVDRYAGQDPEFARFLKGEVADLATTHEPRPLRGDVELKSLRKTKRFFRRRTWCLAGAVEFTVTAFSYHVGPGGIDWTFRASPLLAITFGVAAVLLWIAYFRLRRTTAVVGV